MQNNRGHTDIFKEIIICADDYALHPGISAAIIDLISKQRISAVSCMSNRPLWQEHAAWLKTYTQQIDIGLHFNLTDGDPLSKAAQRYWPNGFISTAKIMLLSHSRLLPTNIIDAELTAQIERFTEFTGQLPDYIDGHQHVHQLPVIRRVLINKIKQLVGRKQIYTRLPANPFLTTLKSPQRLKEFAIKMIGANSFEQQLKKANIAFNSSFSGTYYFDKCKNYRNYFIKFLKQIKARGIILCHPSHLIEDLIDPILRNRWQEYQYLISNDFLSDCEQEKIILTKFRDFLP